MTGVAYSLTPDDIGQVFEAFGPIEFVDLHRDHVSTSHSISDVCDKLTSSTGRVKERLMFSSRTSMLLRWLWMPWTTSSSPVDPVCLFIGHLSDADAQSEYLL